MSLFKNISKNWVIGLLVAMNIALLSFILFMRPSPPIDGKTSTKSGLSKAARVSKHLQKELNLSDEETANLRSFQEVYFKEKNAKYDHIKVLKKEMFAALNLETPDTSKAKDIANQIGNEHQAIEEMMGNHYLELKTKYTSPEQIKKLDRIFERVITRKRSRGKKHKNGSAKGCK